MRGAASFAVPVVANGAVLAAINVAGPATRWNRARRAEARDVVIAEVERLTAELAAASPNRAGVER